MAILVTVNTTSAVQRQVYFDLRELDGITPATAEAGGQPQISVNGAAFTSTGISVLTAVGNGKYYATVTQAVVSSVPAVIESRYSSGTAVEMPGTTLQVVSFNIYDPIALGLSALPQAAAGAAGGIITIGTGAGQLQPSGTGQVGPDFTNIKQATVPTTFTNITIPTVTNVTDGVILASTAFASIPITDPGDISNYTTWDKLMVGVFRRYYKKSTLTSVQLCTYADDNVTVNTTQATSDNGVTQTVNAAT